MNAYEIMYVMRPEQEIVGRLLILHHGRRAER